MNARRNLLAAGAALAGTTLATPALAMTGGWTTLVYGPTMNALDAFTPVGQGNWSFVDGTLQGRDGKDGFLVTRLSWRDFELRAEFWSDEDANSGLFLRCQDRAKVTADNAYEVNICNKRPEPSSGTGAIVNVSQIDRVQRAAYRWNIYRVLARGERLTVSLNGRQTADAHDARHASGPIALQSAGGTVRFRKVHIRDV